MDKAIDNNGGVCRQCGTCCVAPDISTLGKPMGVACRYLNSEMLCDIYTERPDVCRSYMPDYICGLVEAPSIEMRVSRYLDLFGLLEG